MRSIPAPQKPSPAMKKLINKERRQYRDEIARERQKAEQRATEALKEKEQRLQKGTDEDRLRLGFAGSLTSRMTTTLRYAASVDPKLRGKGAAIDLDLQAADGSLGETGWRAYTDFRKISISTEKGRVPDPISSPASDITAFLVGLRGLFHHEAGHCIYSMTPSSFFTEFNDSVRNGTADQDVVDILKGVLGDMSTADDYAPLQYLWNVLEDQRMESARVRDFPACERYFDHLVYDFIAKDRDPEFWANSWTLFAGREYLPLDLWDMSSHMYIRDPQEWLDIVRQYKSAVTVAEMMAAIAAAVVHLGTDGEGGVPDDRMPGEHSSGTGRSAPSDAGASVPGDGSGGAGDAGDPRGLTDDPEYLTAGLGSGGEYFTKKGFTDALTLLSRPEGVEDREVLSKAMTDASRGGLPIYDGSTRPMTVEETRAAEACANGIQMALETHMTALTPTWVLRQEEGVIDPIDYRTRNAGEYTYHAAMSRDMVGEVDMHVSVLADVSGSMSSNMPQLSSQLLGFKLACDAMNIPSNFTLWSSVEQNYSVYQDGGEYVVYPAMGGTDPSDALDDAVLHNVEERDHHLVVILTDGEWYSVDSLEPWRTSSQQKFMVIQYGLSGTRRAIHGADYMFSISSLSEFPLLMERAMDGMIGEVV